MSESLEKLLKRLRDGTGSPSDLVRARALARSDERLPAELREVVFADLDDVEADAAGVLAVLGLDDLGASLAEAVRAELASGAEPEPELDDGWEIVARALREGLEEEARGVDVAEAVLRRLPAKDFAHASLVAPAVTAEAGPVDLSAAVLAGLGEQAVPVAEAVLHEAGAVDVADAVVAELGVDRLPVAEAVREEAGRVVVVPQVMAAIGVWRADAAPEPAARIPANRRRYGLAGFALAAAALLSVVVGRLEVPVASATPDLVFANAAEVEIDDLEVGSDVQVVQLEGDGGAVILWLDGEA